MKINDIVRIQGPEKPLKDEFVVLEIDGEVARLKSKKDERISRIHVSRIIKKGEKKMNQEATETKEEVKTKVKPKVKVAKPKAERKKKEKIPFDLAAWVKESGEHWRKKCEFDRDDYELVAHCAIDEDKGYYHTINTYERSDNKGVLLASGGNKFPLKGHALTTKIKNPKSANIGNNRTLKGIRSADEQREYLKKNKYIKVS